MDLPAARDILTRLSARAPREAAETLLEFIQADHAAHQAALFLVNDEGGLTLIGSIWFNQSAQDWIFATWKRRSPQLNKGIEIQDGDHALIPIVLTHTEVLAGLLYLETPTINMETILDVSQPLAEAMIRASGRGLTASRHPIDDYLGSTPPDEIERRKLLLMLERCEWRISQVARNFKVKRQTIYRWMERLQIPLDRPAR